MTTSSDLSIVIIAKNEQNNLGRCLESLPTGADVAVIDDFSTDETAGIAALKGATVLQHKFESFAKQRNWALRNANLKHDWVLFLDADEVLTSEFREVLAKKISMANDDVVGFTICRKTMFCGKWLRYSDGFPVWIMRVVRRGRAEFVDSGHGEVPVPNVDGLLQSVPEPIVHYPFSKGLSDWFERHNRYSTREAALEFTNLPTFRFRDFASGERSVRRNAIRNLGRRLPGRPLVRFLYQYVWRRGFLDGRAGLAFSTLMGTYEAMIVVKRQELAYLATGENAGPTAPGSLREP